MVQLITPSGFRLWTARPRRRAAHSLLALLILL